MHVRGTCCAFPVLLAYPSTTGDLKGFAAPAHRSTGFLDKPPPVLLASWLPTEKAVVNWEGLKTERTAHH